MLLSLDKLGTKLLWSTRMCLTCLIVTSHSKLLTNLWPGLPLVKWACQYLEITVLHFTDSDRCMLALTHDSSVALIHDSLLENGVWCKYLPALHMFLFWRTHSSLEPIFSVSYLFWPIFRKVYGFYYKPFAVVCILSVSFESMACLFTSSMVTFDKLKFLTSIYLPP